MPRVRGDILELVVSNTKVDLDAILNMRSTPQIGNLGDPPAMAFGSYDWHCVKVTETPVYVYEGNLVVEV